MLDTLGWKIVTITSNKYNSGIGVTIYAPLNIDLV